MKTINYIFIAAILVLACNAPENLADEKNEPVTSILDEHAKLIKSLDDANAILDSIENTGNRPKVETEMQAISVRLRNLNSYILETEADLIQAKKALHKSRKEAAGYEMISVALQNELKSTEAQLQMLSDSLHRYKAPITSEPVARLDK